MRRCWVHARAKVDVEGACRNCGRSDRHLEAAHVLGRVADRYEPLRLEVCPWIKGTGGAKEITYYVHPDRIVPLCAGEWSTCHETYDRHELDLLGSLTPEEEAQLVMDARGLESARKRVYPNAYSDKKVAVA